MLLSHDRGDVRAGAVDFAHLIAKFYSITNKHELYFY
jgi:hypothetical protein